jgi:hypothetical protein
MTRKDYELIARTMRLGLYEGADTVRVAIHADYCAALADALWSDNASFDRIKFMKACGL